MPVLDGYETIVRLKENSISANIPVIFHTSLTRPDIVKKLFDLQAADYIAKPFVPEELLARVEKEIRTLDLQKKLKEKMAKLAEVLSIDTLTKTSNKRHITSIINTRLENLKKTNQGAFSLIYIDIDQFDKFTRHNGIALSNSALKMFAMVTKKCIQEEDILSHYEGDIFLVLLPHSSEEVLNDIAIKIRDNIKKVPFPSNSQLTCSIVLLNINTFETFQNIENTLKSRMQKLKKLHSNSILKMDGRLLV